MFFLNPSHAPTESRLHLSLVRLTLAWCQHPGYEFPRLLAIHSLYRRLARNAD